MTVVEQIKLTARKLAEARGISEPEAYRLILESNPRLYREAEMERQNAGAAGTSTARDYALETVRRGSIRA